MKFLIVDAFTDKAFGGNPAGVVILPPEEDFPSDDIMIKTAAELRYSETAFIKQLGPKEFNIKYFTPAAEVELCGHATIASFSALLHLDIISDNDIYINHTLAETISVEVKNGSIMMDMASPVEIDTIESQSALDELYSIMGIEYKPEVIKDLDGKSITLLPKLISTGLPDIMMPVNNLKDLDNIKPDMNKLAKLSSDYKVVGVHAFTLEHKNNETYNCRNFAPLYDIDEEAATGTSNGALTYYLYLNNLIECNSECIALQGESMDRPSIINTSISTIDRSVKIKVGGCAVMLAEGELHI